LDQVVIIAEHEIWLKEIDDCRCIWEGPKSVLGVGRFAALKSRTVDEPYAFPVVLQSTVGSRICSYLKRRRNLAAGIEEKSLDKTRPASVVITDEMDSGSPVRYDLLQLG